MSHPILANPKTEPKDDANHFADSNRFQDEIYGEITVSDLERDLIDTPEFQRLFRVSQLGLVDLVYPSANHTRGLHSIGCCVVAKELVDLLNCNSMEGITAQIPKITAAERILISLGALLHDISHGPFAHDIEKKNHELRPHKNLVKMKSGYGPYDKHDDYDRNPVLYLTLFDLKRSVLARVLRHYSPAFWRVMKSTEPLKSFVKMVEKSKWPKSDEEILPALLFHVLVFEKFEVASRSHNLSLAKDFDAPAEPWGLGPDPENWETLHHSWYQPYRHDIIGDTLSADLLDYLRRDARRLGLPRDLDRKLLNYYVLVPTDRNPVQEQAGAQRDLQFANLYRCAIDLEDHKRGTHRTERLNDIFRLLDLRYEIHEKAVFHRVVQSAIAMMARALLIVPKEAKPTLKQIFGFDGIESPALCGEDRFLRMLIDATTDTRVCSPSQTIPQKLAERRVYRPLMVIPGDKVPSLLQMDDPADPEPLLREAAAMVDSECFKPYFFFLSWCVEQLLDHGFEADEALYDHITNLTINAEALKKALQLPAPKRVIFWSTPYKQLYKDPGMQVCVRGKTSLIVTTIDRLVDNDEIGESLRERIKAGLRDAKTKYAAMWKLYVFLSDGLFYTGTLAKLVGGACAGPQGERAHVAHLRSAQQLVSRGIRVAWEYWVSSGKNLDLNKQLSLDDFKVLMTLLQAKAVISEKFDLDRSDSISAVRVDQYVHGHDFAKCRDIRYKFDQPGTNATLKSIMEKMRVSSETRELIQQVLKESASPISDFGEEELVEIVDRMKHSPSRLAAAFDEQKAARGEKLLIPAIIQKIWREPEGDAEKWQTK